MPFAYRGSFVVRIGDLATAALVLIRGEAEHYLQEMTGKLPGERLRPITGI